MIELVLERQTKSSKCSRESTNSCSTTDKTLEMQTLEMQTLDAEEYLSALLWTLELTANAVSSQPRRSFLPSRAPTPEELAVYLNYCAIQETRMPHPAGIQLPEAEDDDLTPISPYTVGLSTLPLTSAEKLLPKYLSPLMSELKAEAQEAAGRARGELACLGRSTCRTNESNGSRLIAWLQSRIGSLVGATAMVGVDSWTRSRAEENFGVSSDWVPPEVGFPCVVRPYPPLPVNIYEIFRLPLLSQR